MKLTWISDRMRALLRLSLALALALTLLAAFNAPAWAMAGPWKGPKDDSHQGCPSPPPPCNGGGGGGSVPEIDPRAMASAVTLLIGGTLALAGRRRRG